MGTSHRDFAPSFLDSYIAKEVMGWRESGKHWVDSENIPHIRFHPASDPNQLRQVLARMGIFGYGFGIDFSSPMYLCTGWYARPTDNGWSREEVVKLSADNEAFLLSSAIYYCNEHRLGRL